MNEEQRANLKAAFAKAFQEAKTQVQEASVNAVPKIDFIQPRYLLQDALGNYVYAELVESERTFGAKDEVILKVRYNPQRVFTDPSGESELSLVGQLEGEIALLKESIRLLTGGPAYSKAEESRS
jgi:hypothetical protein